MVWRALSVTRTGGALQSAFFVHEGVEGYTNNRKNARKIILIEQIDIGLYSKINDVTSERNMTDLMTIDNVIFADDARVFSWTCHCVERSK